MPYAWGLPARLQSPVHSAGRWHGGDAKGLGCDRVALGARSAGVALTSPQLGSCDELLGAALHGVSCHGCRLRVDCWALARWCCS